MRAFPMIILKIVENLHFSLKITDFQKNGSVCSVFFIYTAES